MDNHLNVLQNNFVSKIQFAPILFALMVLSSVFPEIVLAQGALVNKTNGKIGLSYSTSFVTATRNSDGAEAKLISDSDYAPYAAFATPPLFLFGSATALGLSMSYAQFEASTQEFATQGPQPIGSKAKVRMLVVTPALSYYMGKTSPSQFLRLSAGMGWAWSQISGKVEFGDKPGAEPPEDLVAPSSPSQAVSFAAEYRVRSLSLAVYLGGPKIENDQHTYQMGDNSVVLSYVFAL